MKKICAWCRKEIGSAGASRPNEAVTHGICDDCLDNIDFQEGVAMREYLNALAAPIVMVDSRMVVRSANEAAVALLGKQYEEIDGHLGGEVFECEYARLPEGCGNTVHCAGCAIRRSVMETFETGESRLRVPATLKRHTRQDPQDVRFSISTEKVGDIVLLRVDQVDG